MGGAFFTGLSGLAASSLGIKVTGNNLANVNTIGYKANNAFFQELLFAGKNDIQVGQGVTPTSIQQVWSQGNIQQSQISTDMAIQGAGYFVVGDGVNSQFYTRAGNFIINKEGKLVTPEGKFVLGYPQVNGQIDTNANLTVLNLAPGQILPAVPTSVIRLTTNLNSETTTGESFSTSTLVYDSLGASHAVTFKFTKTATGWDYELSVPAADVGGLATAPPKVIATGSLTFDNKGKLTSPTGDVTGITITGFTNKAADLKFDWDLFGPNSAVYLSQFNLPSSTSETFQNGNSSGSLASIIVRANGVVEGLFTNGETAPLGQIAIATFTNPQGLVKAGANLYARTTQSGEPTVGAAGAGGRGELRGNALEMSNVDIAEEFIKLIIFQRAYQANSRLITTADEVTQEAIQLKR